MQNGDFPPSFLPTKVCLLMLTSSFITSLFMHIKILWGLLKQDLVPRAPDLSALEEFYRRFRQTKKIEQAVNSGLENSPIPKQIGHSPRQQLRLLHSRTHGLIGLINLPLPRMLTSKSIPKWPKTCPCSYRLTIISYTISN
ncbi:hypothetical protein VP01_1267g5 [Puccinia sorghi]|uniref:Uncharacterized protein n=1 Tax=Puccinia sorghi TaxID=27349 RepID=A0A0L6VP22_9BASI|nr:hypothetical protein VP01_1267g5 [Puccinia sorghi]